MMDDIESLLRDLGRFKEARAPTQVREIVPIEEWLESPYFVGEDGCRLYDVWKDELSKVFPTGEHRSEWIIHGSLGSGKSTAGEFGLIRKIYELSCFEPIPYLFNFMRSSTIFFIYFSITLFQAERTGFGKMRTILDSIPYFTRRFGRNRDKNSVLEFQNLSLISGSDVGHQVGTDLIGALLDEANFMDRRFNALSADYSKVAKIYSSVLNRRLNRFVVGGIDHGLSVLISSASTSSSFTETRIKSSQDNPHSVISEVTTYRVKRKEYKDEEFCVFLGTEMIDPCLIDSIEDLDRILEMLKLERDPSVVNLRIAAKLADKDQTPSLFEWVPMDFRKQFEEGLLDAIQDVIGHSTRPMGKLFQGRDRYQKAVEIADAGGLVHPFTSDIILLTTGDDRMIQDHIDLSKMGPKDAARAISIDQSKTSDWTGISSSYVMGYEDFRGEMLPIIRVEFMLGIQPPPKPFEIPIERSRLFVMWLIGQGYNVSRVTYDAYGSVESIQILQAEGVPAIAYSVDKTDEAYKTLVSLYNVGPRIVHYDHEVYRRELFDLEHDRTKGKIDHPSSGSKDIADAVCASVNNALLSIPPEPSIRFI